MNHDDHSIDAELRSLRADVNAMQRENIRLLTIAEAAAETMRELVAENQRLRKHIAAHEAGIDTANLSQH